MSFKALVNNYAYNTIGIRGSCLGKYFIILINNGLIKKSRLFFMKIIFLAIIIANHNVMTCDTYRLKIQMVHVMVRVPS